MKKVTVQLIAEPIENSYTKKRFARAIIDKIISYYKDQGLEFSKVEDETESLSSGYAFMASLGTKKRGAPFIEVSVTETGSNNEQVYVYIGNVGNKKGLHEFMDAGVDKIFKYFVLRLNNNKARQKLFLYNAVHNVKQ